MAIKYKLEGKFSELFPKSFVFIKNLMLAKYDWPKDTPIPDLTVKIFVDDEYKVTRRSSVPAAYLPNRGEIVIFAKTMLENTLPDIASGRGIIEFPKLDEEKIKEILVERHEFSMERVEKQLDKLKMVKKREQWHAQPLNL